MDYEKAYKNLVAKVKNAHLFAQTDSTKNVLEDILPELRESEDERMMREFNDWLCEEIECRTNDLRDEKDRRTLNMLCYILTKVKDWLEKQKERGPCGCVNAESEYDKGWRDGHKAGLKDAEMQKPVEIHNPTDEEIESWRKELTEFKKFATKQAKENQLHISYTRDVMWENFCSELLSFVNSRKPTWSEEDDKIMQTMIKEGDLKPSEIAWLKSLRPSWKPSEEQMKALEIAFRKDGDDKYLSTINSLYYDLKKL